MNDVLTEKIKRWAKERNLHDADPYKQFLKLAEEVGELSQALAKNKRKEAIMEEIGGIYVVLTILSMQLNLDVRKCIEFEYDKIVNRTGRMVNGIFVKEDDLIELKEKEESELTKLPNRAEVSI